MPKTRKPSESIADIAARAKSNIRNILLTSPYFPRLYADVVLTYAPNSNEARILAPHYKKIVERTNADCAKADRIKIERTTPMPNVKNCTHIRVTGVRCGSPALRGEQFCYFHQRMLRTVKGPDSRIHHAALLEDEESIQASLIEVVNALLRGTIEIKRAELILRALNTAVRNIRRVKFSRHADMIREIPTYPAAPPTEVDETARAEAAKQATRAEIARVRAAHMETTPAATSQVETSAPEPPIRSNPSTNKNAAIDPTQRKPAVSVKSAQILHSRKQRARSG
jgi:hypothetical protein